MTRCLLVALSATLLQVPMQAPQHPRESAERFVQRFYDRYLAMLHAEGISSNRVLREQRSLFSRELYRALVEDSLAGSQADDEVAALEFDPFVNSQDPCERYIAAAPAAGGEVTAVQVNEVCAGHAGRQPAVVARVHRIQGRWVFVDFDYGRGSHLLGILRQLRAERSRHRSP